MKFNIITIFPDIFDSYLNESILKRAQKKGLIKIKMHNLRDFASGKYKKVDDRPFGGGPGMALKAEPIAKAIADLIRRKAKNEKRKIILFSAVGRQFDNKTAADLAKKYNHLILICGRYEGIDERIKKMLRALSFKFQELSIGPYVLTGGELPAMVLIDAVSRHIPGVLGKQDSVEEKREGIGIPTYTRPEVIEFSGKKYRAPKVLLSGNHKKIEQWRRQHKRDIAKC